MPRAHPTAIRHQILGLRSQGLSLVQIASQLLLPYSSVRRLCRRHRDDPARPLNPDYSRCGRRHTAATEALFQAACALKRNHPTWGAGIIRVQLSEQYPGQAMPSVRALQQAFRRAGVNRPRPPRPSTPATPRATVPHQIWEVDAKERVRLASGQRVSWLAFTDEASGALLATPLFPPGALAERPHHHDPGHVPPHVHPLGPARGGPCRQRVSLGVTADLPTELALWLIGLGVAVIWNPPAQPRKNPKVERCQGVAAAWAEPQACADLAALSAHLDWVGRVQCQEYPSIGGSTRVEAYPGLLIARRAYQESQEPTLWELGRVDRWLSPRTWNRRVDQNGVISIYGHHHWVGRVYRGQDMTVRYDGLARQWVVRDQTGEIAWRFEARELSREAILGLAVSRKRGRRQKS